MMNGRVDHLIPEFIINPKYRIYRHLLLFFVITVIVASGIVNNYSFNAEAKSSAIWGCVYYYAVYLGVIYLNMYVYVPVLLMKKRYFIYLLVMFLTIVFALFILAAFLFSYFGLNELHQEVGNFSLGINFISALAILSLMILGSTTARLFKYWILNNRRIDELETATLQSELQLLKNQINPHFLFNMLNNANVLIWKSPAEATQVLFKLEDLLRYQLNDTFKEKVSLSSDIHFLNDFLNLEKVRRDRFEFTITRVGEIERIELPALLFIPFVENAVKHNPDNEYLSYINLTFIACRNRLEFRCENSKPAQEIKQQQSGGIGLKNIQRRLALLYPEQHSLEIRDKETTYTVILKLTL